MKNDLKMYFDQDVVNEFVKREENEKYFGVTRIIELISLSILKKVNRPWVIADLGAGAHSEQYNNLFSELLKDPHGKFYWVDLSALMLDKAEKYLVDEELLARKNVIEWVEEDIVEYLDKLGDDYLDLAIMKYTFDHLEKIEEFITLIARVLKPGGSMVADFNIGTAKLPSLSQNARYLYKGEEFELGEVRELEDGEAYGVRFLRKYNDLSSGYLEGAEVTKYYHSVEKIKNLAGKVGLKVYVGNWLEWVIGLESEKVDLDLDVMVLTKG